MRRRQCHGRRQQPDDDAAIVEKRTAADPQQDDEDGARPDAQAHRAAGQRQCGADRGAGQRDQPIAPEADHGRAPAVEQLGQSVGMDDDSRHHPLALHRDRRERRAVPIRQAQIGADEDDLVLEELRRQGGHELRRILAKGRHAARWLAMPRHVHEPRRRRHADIGGEEARQAADVLPVGADMARIDPAHRIELVGREIGEPAQGLRDEAFEKGLLVFGDGARRIGIAHRERNAELPQRRSQLLVLRGFGRLIQQQIESDGARPTARQRGQQIAQEPAVDRRAIRESLQRIFGDRHDYDVGILRLGRQQRGGLPIGDVAVAIFEERHAFDGQDHAGRGDERDNRRHGHAHQPARPCRGSQAHARASDHWLRRDRASACASQP